MIIKKELNVPSFFFWLKFRYNFWVKGISDILFSLVTVHVRIQLTTIYDLMPYAPGLNVIPSKPNRVKLNNEMHCSLFIYPLIRFRLTRLLVYIPLSKPNQATEVENSFCVLGNVLKGHSHFFSFSLIN